MKNIALYILIIITLSTIVSCRKDEHIVVANTSGFPEVYPRFKNSGMYLLNEGNMGSNKSTLDYLDFLNSIYIVNCYPERNPTVVKELGDVGNDIQIYGNRLYAVINCSNKVEVMDARTGIRIGQVEIPNCRYVRFHRGYAYITSYVAGCSDRPKCTAGGSIQSRYNKPADYR